MKVTYKYFREDDALYVYVSGLPPLSPEEVDWESLGAWGIDAIVDGGGRHYKYEVVRLGDLYQNGPIEMPPGFQEPPHLFQIDEVPGRSFTLQGLIDWIHDRVTTSA